jgi:hypothetical protein
MKGYSIIGLFIGYTVQSEYVEPSFGVTEFLRILK